MEPERGQGAKQDQRRCEEQLSRAIHSLGGQVQGDHIAKMARLIIQAMTGQWRFFHTPEHIFEVGEGGDAIEVLAALFHDLVYVQVDQGVSVNISSYISVFVEEIDGHLKIRDRSELPNDPMFELVLQVFGFADGQVLVPTAGQNEFLSAVIAAKCLEQLLTPAMIAQIAACIEATIPFRATSESGQKPSDRLYQRLRQTNQTFQFGWSEADLITVVERAVRLANRDVENFAYPSSADFLDNTWNLLPETNHFLKAAAYTVQGYRKSLQKMEGFMYFLTPELVFQRFHNEPDERGYRDLIARTQKNLQVARLYLGSKLLSIAVVEALSRRIGRDISLTTMMGELAAPGMPNSSVPQLKEFLPKTVRMPFPPETDLEREVLRLLEEGRRQPSSYDIKNSPVATFIVKSVGFDETRRLILAAKTFFKAAEEEETLSQGAIASEEFLARCARGVSASEEFLAQCDPDMLEPITNGVLQVFENRKVAMRGLSPNLKAAS